ncbi:uncharacterized protein LOC143818575 [Ranitomeya variabilis]|uniref:uncharacterized protein LOC143818575 n=1 Tax=Ranitomeya variabilis TaxID=490064 RepID=UPI004055A2FD
MKSPSMRSNHHYKDLLASLDLLAVPLLEDSIPGIVTSFELGEMKTLTSVLIEHLHDLDGQDLVNALLFLSTITSARADADTFLTNELIEKTYSHMLKAESERRQGITGAAMTLLANIAVYRSKEVIERLQIDDEHSHCSALKILDLINNKTIRYWKDRKSGEQNILTVDELITHTQYQAGPPESFDICYHLLHPSYGFINHQDDSEVLHDTDTAQAAMCRYITCVLTEEERRKIIHYLLIAMRSAVRTSKLISVMFFSELLRHSELLEEKMAKDLILFMASRMESQDRLEVCLAVEAMGNASEGAPRQVHQLKDVIFAGLCRKLSGHQTLKVVIKSLKALSKTFTLLKSSKLGRTFGMIVRLCTHYLNHPNIVIQTYATSLLGDLAQSCNWSKRSFSRHVRRFLPDLLIKLHSKDQQVKASGIAALLHCLPYIACTNAEELLKADGEKSCQIYEQLGQKEPALLVDMMIHSIELLYTIREVDAVMKHLTMIRDALPYEELYPTALRDMFIGLRKLVTQFYLPEVKEASYRAMDILGTKWRSIGSAKVAKVGTRSNTLLERVEIARIKRVEIIVYETSV